MDIYEQNRMLKAIVCDLMETRIGCVSMALVDSAILGTLVEAVDDLPTSPPAELKQAFDAYALFQQVQDAHEVS